MKVILKKQISFKDFDEKIINIPEGTEIYLDIEEHIGFFEDNHFDVSKDEYLIIN